MIVIVWNIDDLPQSTSPFENMEEIEWLQMDVLEDL